MGQFVVPYLVPKLMECTGTSPKRHLLKDMTSANFQFTLYFRVVIMD